MQIPVVEKRLSDLLPANTMLMFGLVKAGGVIIDKNNETVTIEQPYSYSRLELKNMQSQVESWKQQYIQQVQNMNPDQDVNIIAANEIAQFNEALKIYDQLLQVMI